MCEISEPDDYCDVWKWEKRKARKPHECDGCGGPIARGTAYFFHSSLYDGMWSTERCCAACDAAQHEFSEAHDGMSWSPSGFRDALEYCVSEEDEASGKWKPMLDAVVARGRATP